MAGIDPDVKAAWEKFLNPVALRTNLVLASLYLSAWEILKNSIVDQLKGFYCIGWNATTGESFDVKYEQKVLSLDKSPLRASLLWFQDMGVVDAAELELVDRLREHRNDIAHHLPAFVAGRRDVKVELIESLCLLVTKIDRWWIREIEIPTSGDFTAEEAETIIDNEISSGNMMFLSILLQIATGNDEDAGKFYEHFMATTTQATAKE
jgi:hypothetical protein